MFKHRAFYRRLLRGRCVERALRRTRSRFSRSERSSRNSRCVGGAAACRGPSALPIDRAQFSISSGDRRCANYPVIIGCGPSSASTRVVRITFWQRPADNPNGRIEAAGAKALGA